MPGTGPGLPSWTSLSTSSFSPRLWDTIRFYFILSPALDPWAYLFKGIITRIFLLSSFLSTSALPISSPNSLLNLLHICEVWTLSGHLTLLQNDFIYSSCLKLSLLGENLTSYFTENKRAISIHFPHHTLPTCSCQDSSLFILRSLNLGS